MPWGREVLVAFEDGIAWVSINRPDRRNAMSVDLAFEMLATLDALETDDRCGVLVLTGVGESFSAGMDLRDYFRKLDTLEPKDRARVYRANIDWQWNRLVHYPKATIAMVNGWCFGGAFVPLIACDLAIADQDASFGLSEINWGIIPAGGVSKAVTEVMSHRDALYYAMTGETFSGRKAAEMKLVNEAVPKEVLRQRTGELAKTLLGKNPTVLRATKTAIKFSEDLSWEQSCEYLRAKLDQTIAQDPERGRERGLRQFIDQKSFKPGLQSYRRGD
ncbi:MAG: p-hydroxycinnamoyl CoA hydratase/lyase [Hyphomicrobiales bacterium]|nr:p-hydroxycinnamoyl CoA hydratase/lyase [Hyphomicrobiales bacterium]